MRDLPDITAVSWVVLRILGHLGASWGVLGASWGVLGPSWERLGGVLDVLEATWSVLARLSGDEQKRVEGDPPMFEDVSRFSLTFER